MDENGKVVTSASASGARGEDHAEAIAANVLAMMVGTASRTKSNCEESHCCGPLCVVCGHGCEYAHQIKSAKAMFRCGFSSPDFPRETLNPEPLILVYACRSSRSIRCMSRRAKCQTWGSLSQRSQTLNPQTLKTLKTLNSQIRKPVNLRSPKPSKLQIRKSPFTSTLALGGRASSPYQLELQTPTLHPSGPSGHALF